MTLDELPDRVAHRRLRASYAENDYPPDEDTDEARDALYREGLAALRAREPWRFGEIEEARTDRDLPGYDRGFGDDAA